MATTSTTLSISSSSTLIDASTKAPPTRLQSQCSVSLPAAGIPSLPTAQPRLAKTTAYCRKIARNVVAMATGEVAPVEVVDSTTETPEILKTISEVWDKVDDKYAVTSLAVAGGVALWASAGMISAIDRLPLVPGVLELVGIGYTGYFAYKNLLSKPDRDSLFQKVKNTYNDILGTS